MRNDIIPITFIGGSGGHFLTNLLMDAKHKTNNPITLSNNGNIHFTRINIQDISGPPFSIVDSDISKIEYVLNSEITGTIPPYFVPLHIADLNLCKEYFSKIIRITYELDDVPNLAKVYVFKSLVDEKDLDLELINYSIKQRKIFLVENLHDFLPTPTNEEQVLNISWCELITENTISLVEKLSKFTDIPVADFNIQNIVTWRNKTMDCINSLV